MEKEVSHSEMAEENHSDATSEYSSKSSTMEEHELVPLNKDPSSEPLLDKKESRKRSIRQWNWKNIAVVASLAMCYLLCNMAFSTISPFYPEEARTL